MNKRFLPPLAAAIFVLASSLAGFAQMTGVQGVVRDQNGAGVPGLQVIWHNTDNNREYKFKTNKKGEYQGLGVLIGHYDVKVYQDTRVIAQQDKVDLKSGDSLNPPSYDFKIAPANPAPGADAGPTPTPVPPTEEDMKRMKMSKEQQEKVKEIEEHNKKVEAENKKIGDINGLIAQTKEAMKAGKWDDAITSAQQATQAGSGYDLTWGYLGDAELGAKHYQESVDAYQKAIDINTASSKPNLEFQGVWNHNMAKALMKLQKFTEGQTAFETAAKDQPTGAAKDYFDEGIEYLNASRIDPAVAAFDRAIAADPNLADAYFQKGVALVNKATMQGTKLVAPPGTEEALQKYLELAPNGPNAANATEVLQTLGAKVKTTYKSGK